MQHAKKTRLPRAKKKREDNRGEYFFLFPFSAPCVDVARAASVVQVTSVRGASTWALVRTSAGKQNKFLSGADVAAACFGHMLASVWDGSNVRRQNKDRLKQCLALSASEVGNAADAPPQRAAYASRDELMTRMYEFFAQKHLPGWCS